MRGIRPFLRYGCLGCLLILGVLFIAVAGFALGTFFYFSRSSKPNFTMTIPTKTDTGESLNVVVQIANDHSLTVDQVKQMMEASRFRADFTIRGPAGLKLFGGEVSVKVPLDEIIDKVEGRLGEGVPVEQLMQTNPGQAAQELFGSSADMPLSEFIKQAPSGVLEDTFGKDFKTRLQVLAGGDMAKTVRQVFKEKPDDVLALLKEARRVGFLGQIFDKMTENQQTSGVSQSGGQSGGQPR